MEGKIIRNIDGNSLVFECDEVDYRLKMLEANKIPGLLPLMIKENDGKKELCYDITSKECFAALTARRTMKVDDIRSFIYCLSRIIISIEAYLLNPEDLLLDKEYIYVQGEDIEPVLCYLPGYEGDFTSKLSMLLQEMLGMVDHNDHDAVVLVYSLYQESLKQGYVMKDLIKILNTDFSTQENKPEQKKNGKADSEINYVTVEQENTPVLTQSEYESLYDAMDTRPKAVEQEVKSHKRKRGIMFNLW